MRRCLGTVPRPAHAISLTVVDVPRAVLQSTKSLQPACQEGDDQASTHCLRSRDALLGSPTSSWSPRGLVFVLPSPYGKLHFTPGCKWILFEKTHCWRCRMGLQSAFLSLCYTLVKHLCLVLLFFLLFSSHQLLNAGCHMRKVRLRWKKLLCLLLSWFTFVLLLLFQLSWGNVSQGGMSQRNGLLLPKGNGSHPNPWPKFLLPPMLGMLRTGPSLSKSSG